MVGPTRSLFIWTGVKQGKSIVLEPVPPHRIIAADLTGWTYLARRGTVAVDPVLGRIAFPPQQPPKYGVWVSYHYGFSGDMGGGEYDRPLVRSPRGGALPVSQGGALDTIGKALERWRTEQPRDAVIEIDDGRVYVEPIQIEFSPGQESLQLRAANGRRPVIRLLDWQTSQPDALTVIGKGGDRFVLDGIMVTGRGLQVGGDLKRLTIRHTTLVPGWAIDSDCRSPAPDGAEPRSLCPQRVRRRGAQHRGYRFQVRPGRIPAPDEDAGDEAQSHARRRKMKCSRPGAKAAAPMSGSIRSDYASATASSTRPAPGRKRSAPRDVRSRTRS